MSIARGREGSRGKGKGTWRGKEEREVERDETKKMGKERRWNKKEKSAGEERRKREVTAKTGGGEGLREEEEWRGNMKLTTARGQQWGGRTEVTWTSSHPCTVKTWLRSLCIVPSGLN